MLRILDSSVTTFLTVIKIAIEATVPVPPRSVVQVAQIIFIVLMWWMKSTGLYQFSNHVFVVGATGQTTTGFTETGTRPTVVTRVEQLFHRLCTGATQWQLLRHQFSLVDVEFFWKSREALDLIDKRSEGHGRPSSKCERLVFGIDVA